MIRIHNNKVDLSNQYNILKELNQPIKIIDIVDDQND